MNIATQTDPSVTVAADTVVDATGTRGVFATEQGSKKLSIDPFESLVDFLLGKLAAPEVFVSSHPPQSPREAQVPGEIRE